MSTMATPTGTPIALHLPPTRREVIGEQIRAVGLSLRFEGFLFLAAIVVIGLFAIGEALDVASRGAGVGFVFGVAAAFPMIVVALLLPFGVWRNEEPARRGYHLAMPVEPGAHTLARIAAGWLWLMAAVAVYLVGVALIGIVPPLLVSQRVPLFDGAGWQWIVPFTAASISYLLVSLAVVGSEHPWRWIGGLAIGYALSQGLLVELGLGELGAFIDEIRAGRYGLVAGAFAQVYELVRYPTAHYVLSAQRWIGATLIWGTLGVVAVVLVARRRRDT